MSISPLFGTAYNPSASRRPDTASVPGPVRALFQQLPKTDLHVHLDGSLRPETMIELARAQGRTLPRWDADELGDYVRAYGVAIEERAADQRRQVSSPNKV